ncbi:hypothetical protein C8Q76DRAFT_862827 [Earliella scabrosa]|nr:hypothetical protein C8Q76DRAFT_862827 [Earliella scabrosa]
MHVPKRSRGLHIDGLPQTPPRSPLSPPTAGLTAALLLSDTMPEPVIIDDADSAVVYSNSPGWILDRLRGSMGDTRHGATHAGQTVSVKFQGTGIQVFSVLENVKRARQPQVSLSIDGAFIANVTGPFKADGDSEFNVTFFSQRDLPFGEHELSMKNLIDQSPTTFWLDYFLVDPGHPPPSTADLQVSVSSTPASPVQTPVPQTVLSSSSSTILAPYTSITSKPMLSTSPSNSVPTISPGSSEFSNQTSSPSSLVHIASSDPPSISPSTPVSPLLNHSAAGELAGSSRVDGGEPSTSLSILASSEALPSGIVAGSGASEGPSQSSRSDLPAIVGGVVGGLVLVSILIAVVLFRRRRRAPKNDRGLLNSSSSMCSSAHSTVYGSMSKYQPSMRSDADPNPAYAALCESALFDRADRAVDSSSMTSRASETQLSVYPTQSLESWHAL